ncbi:MAG: type III-B CRISPR module RAMP protein Cmr6 [Desulfamplus sp.]|nr:type III-B CRISPR module RAMP protein Cmr6 [Desulfamplus sp.]
MALEKRFDPQNLLFPVPEYLQKHFGSLANYGLYFQKFCRYQQSMSQIELKTQDSWNNGRRGRERMDYEWSLLDNQITHAVVLKNAQPLLERFHDRQSRCLESFAGLGSEVMEISARSITPLLTGIGEASPTEVGMGFHRNMGIPFLKASSIKGAVRYAYCVNFARNNPDKVMDGSIDESRVDGLKELFGSLDTNDGFRGGFAFMDCCSVDVPELKMDIMNPHHGDYYQNKNNRGPIETESPVPIKFLVVKKGQEYKFRGYFITQGAKEYRRELMDAFETALTLLGLGAKTAVGYGRFDTIRDTSPEIVERAKERKKQQEREEKERKEREEAERKAALEKAEEERKKAEAEEAKRQEEIKKAAQAEAYKAALETAQGIDRDILLLSHEGNEDIAIKAYDVHLKGLKILGEKEMELALLVESHFKKWNKKTKKNKLKRKDELTKLMKV